MEERKINLDCVHGFDSVTYRKVLEFIQKEGTEPFEKLINDISKMQEPLLAAIMFGKHPTLNLVRNNKIVTEFLRQFGYYFLHNGQSYSDEKFRKFIANISENIDKLNLYIENVKRLEELKVCMIDFRDIKDSWELHNNGMGVVKIWRKDNKITDIRKNYTDGTINYSLKIKRSKYGRYFEEYRIRVSKNEDIENSPTWYIQCENGDSGKQYRYAWIEDFGFNGELLPTNEELSSYEEPQTLKLAAANGLIKR